MCGLHLLLGPQWTAQSWRGAASVHAIDISPVVIVLYAPYQTVSGTAISGRPHHGAIAWAARRESRVREAADTVAGIAAIADP